MAAERGHLFRLAAADGFVDFNAVAFPRKAFSSIAREQIAAGTD
jgi:hypothetical protein